LLHCGRFVKCPQRPAATRAPMCPPADRHRSSALRCPTPRLSIRTVMPCVHSPSLRVQQLFCTLLLMLVVSAHASAQRVFSTGFEPLPLCQLSLAEAPIVAQPTAGAAFFGQPAR